MQYSEQHEKVGKYHTAHCQETPLIPGLIVIGTNEQKPEVEAILYQTNCILSLKIACRLFTIQWTECDWMRKNKAWEKLRTLYHVHGKSAWDN
jgi:hypothetical protein